MMIDNKTLEQVIDRVAKEVAEKVCAVGVVSIHEQANTAARSALEAVRHLESVTTLMQGLASSCLEAPGGDDKAAAGHQVYGEIQRLVRYTRDHLAVVDSALQQAAALASRLEQIGG